jgi:protein-disulfide isomerase
LVGNFQVSNGETISVQVLKKEECPTPGNPDSCVSIYSISNRDNGNMKVSLEPGKEYYLVFQNNALLFPTKTVDINFEIQFGNSQVDDLSLEDTRSAEDLNNPINYEQLVERLTTSSVLGAEALGDPNAEISIIEFGDYQDSFSAAFNRDTKDALVSKYIDTGIATFGFKNLIINDLQVDGLSTFAAEASYCAAEQDKYWEFHDKVYENSKGENTGWITRENLIGFATNIGIPNTDQFTQCLDSHKYNIQIVNDDSFSKNLGLASTPTFLIIKEGSSKVTAIEGAQPINVFEDTINQILNGTI